MVTGAGRGIGRAISLAFASEGANLILTARSETELQSVASEIKESGLTALVIPCDVSQPSQVESLFQKTQQHYGSLDILVNNAGMINPIGPIEKTDPIEWMNTISVNLFGTYNCSRAAVPIMQAQRYGKIINMSGGGATSANPFFSAYSTSKAGIVRLTDTLAAELEAFHIDVNAIAPGPVYTQIIKDIINAGDHAGEKLKSQALNVQESESDPTRVTQLATFLASEASDGLTGRLISAIWDEWDSFTAEKIHEIVEKDWYQLRRTVPPS